MGRVEEALSCALERARLAGEAGLAARRIQILGDNVADCEMALGRGESAETRCREALLAMGSMAGAQPMISHVLDTLTRALVMRGKHTEAIEVARRALKASRNDGFHFRLLEPLAINAAHLGRSEDAAWIVGHVDAIYLVRGEVRWPDVAARRRELDALLEQTLDPATLSRLRAKGSQATIDECFARAFGDG